MAGRGHQGAFWPVHGQGLDEHKGQRHMECGRSGVTLLATHRPREPGGSPLVRYAYAGLKFVTCTSRDSPWILTTALWSWDFRYPHFNEEEADVQRGQVRGPRSHSQAVVRPGCQPDGQRRVPAMPAEPPVQLHIF